MSNDKTATPAETGEIPAWKKRAQEELAQLRERICQLEDFTKEDCDLKRCNLSKVQLSAMLAYEVALSNRIEL